MQGGGIQRIAGAPGAALGSSRPGVSTGFAVPGELVPASSRAPAAITASSALLGLLAVQEAEGDAVRDRAARRRGGRMLDELAKLQRALLAGRLDPATLRSLAELAADPADAADPAIAAAVRAVAVRARVMLAQLAAAARK